MEVFSLKPITWKDSSIFVQGRFTLVNGAAEGVFFRLENAEPIQPPSLLSRLPGLPGQPGEGVQ